MEFPSWDAFSRKDGLVDKFIKLSKQKAESFKHHEELLITAMQVSFKIFPEPLYSIAVSIYEDSPESPLQKNDQVVKYFSGIVEKGRESYERKANVINKVLRKFQYPSFNIAVEEQRQIVNLIHDLMRAEVSEIDQRIVNLQRDIDIANTIPLLSNALSITGDAFGLAEKSLQSNKLDNNEVPAITEKTLLVESQGRVINMKAGNSIINSIDREILPQLTDTDQRSLIRYEKAMENYHRIIMNIETSETTAAHDPAKEEILKIQKEEYIKKMCNELKNIHSILRKFGMDINALNQHTSIINICKGDFS
jgi:hypothetical protein